MPSSAASRVIWVVDDSRLDAERARRLLARDHEVHVFSDGSSALEQLAGGWSPPDVIVLDWVMPGVTGVEVCRFLRAAGRATQKIGVLLLTVHRDTEQIVEGLSAGANDFLAKPYEDEELRARVGALLRTRMLMDELERAELENRQMLESAPDALLVVDPGGRLTFHNQLASTVFGSEVGALLGQPITTLLPELPCERIDLLPGELATPLDDVTRGGRRYSPTLRRTNGGNTVISLRDVSEQRILEERRLDFYSMIAHDLRTPINAMTLRVSTMIEFYRVGSPLSVEAELGKLDQRLRSLVQLLNDFLDLARLESQSGRLARAELDLIPLVHQVGEDFAPLLEAAQLRLQVLAEPGEVTLTGDANRLLQVLTNLIANAIKFSPKGASVVVSQRVEERFVELSVADSGPGVEAALIPKLFQRYARAEHSKGGTGLGLLIVREIIEAHGGTVGVESSGRGSRFWFRLPRLAGVSLPPLVEGE